MPNLVIKNLPRIGENSSMTLDVSTYNGELLAQILFDKEMQGRTFDAEWMEGETDVTV